MAFPAIGNLFSRPHKPLTVVEALTAEVAVISPGANGGTSSTSPQDSGTPQELRRRRWVGLPVIQTIKGSLAEILNQLPQFGRQPFIMSSLNGDGVGVNPYLDMIYRLPTRKGEATVPVGVVSKNYRLVDHHQLLRTITDALTECGVRTSELEVHAEWTINAERARFSLIFPNDERFRVELNSEDEMRFRIEVFNSVEGSCRLMVVAGWLRFVCSNGLILGTALMQLRQQHRQQIQIEDLGRLLKEALQSTQDDQDRIAEWREHVIPDHTLAEWVDDAVRSKWGLKGAVRVLAIARTGRDVELKGDLKNKRPSEVAIQQTTEVPGMDPPLASAFGVSQALTWVAGQKSELQEDLDRRIQVPELMDLLLTRSAANNPLFA